MKTREFNSKYSRWSRFILSALVGLFTANCQVQQLELSDNLQPSQEGEEVEFKLLLSSSDRVESRSGATQDESRIDYQNIYLLSVDNQGLLTDMPALAHVVESSGETTTLSAPLNPTSEPRVVHVLINSNLSPLNTKGLEWQVGTTKIDEIAAKFLTQSLESSKSSGWIVDKFQGNHPMSGSVKLGSGIRAGGQITIPIKRVTSKLVVTRQEAIAPYFTLLGASLIDAPVASSFIEWESPNSEIPIANYSSKLGSLDAMHQGATNGGKATLPIYFYESFIEDNQTAIIIKANYKGADSYYKLDFRDSNLKRFEELNRNTLYTVLISKVQKSGYSTAQEAYDNPAANTTGSLEIEVEVVDDSSLDIVSQGSKYLGFTNSEFVIYANSINRVVATLMNHNAQNEDNLTITIVGDGVTLSKSSGLSISQDKKSATLTSADGSVGEVAIKLDVTQAMSNATLIVTSGELRKSINLTRYDEVDNSRAITLDPEEYSGSDFVWTESNSESLTVNSNNSITVGVSKGKYNRGSALAKVRGFCDNSRGNVLIAVKKPLCQFVYYERYADGSYGYYVDTDNYDLSQTKGVDKYGYGYISSNVSPSMRLTIDGDSHYCEAVEMDNQSLGYQVNLYGVDEDDLPLIRSLDGPLVAKIEGSSTRSYFCPNFACGIYPNNSLNHSEDNPFIIRTASQFENINTLICSIVDKYYEQQRDIDFKCQADRSSTIYHDPVLQDSFWGVYDGGNYYIENLIIEDNCDCGSYGLMINLRGTVRNVKLNNIEIEGWMQVGGIAGSAGKDAVVENVEIYNSRFTGQQYVGGIIGENYDNLARISSCTNYSGTIEAGKIGGGIVGLIDNYGTESVIEGCANYAEVKGGANLGGIVGVSYGKVRNCLVVDNRVNPTTPLIMGTMYNGGVVGYNLGTVSHVMVLDSHQSGNIPLVGNSAGESVGSGGIIAQDQGTSDYALYIAKASAKNGKISPVIYLQSYKKLRNYYFLSGCSFNSESYNENLAIPMTTSEFESMDLTQGSWSSYWARVDGFPYPMLKSFSVPNSWIEAD